MDFRNVLIHEYFGIDAEEVWGIIQNYLPLFKEEIEGKIFQLPKESFLELLEDIIEENGHIPYILENLQILRKRYLSK